MSELPALHQSSQLGSQQSIYKLYLNVQLLQVLSDSFLLWEYTDSDHIKLSGTKTDILSNVHTQHISLKLKKLFLSVPRSTVKYWCLDVGMLKD
jgi:hypothetical protein